jgi:tRNA(Ile)-lysidine synthase
LVKRVAETILRYNMFDRNESVGVAVSGGADSTALLHVLMDLSSRWQWRLTVLHLNHGLRGEESDGDAQFVAAMATRLNLPLVTRSVRVQDVSGNLEEAGRRFRHEFFRDAMRSHGLARVAVGHTRSDQAETVLYRLLRGSGTTGLSGIWPVTDDGIVRPLIEVSRDEILDWLRERRIAWREDSSNEETRFARNRIRHGLLPQLRRDWNPALDTALGQFAELCQDEERYWRDESKRLLDECAVNHGASLVLDLGRVRALPVAALRRLLREAVAQVRPDCHPVPFAHIEKLVTLARQAPGSGFLTLPGLEARRSFGQLRLGPSGSRGSSYRLELPVPGMVPLPGGGRIEALLEPPIRESRYNIDGVALDRERAPGKLELRSWTPGVAFWPAGQKRAIKLKDLFQQARIPSWERPVWPMIHHGDAVIWLRGFGAAEGFAATPSTRTVLRVREDPPRNVSGWPRPASKQV